MMFTHIYSFLQSDTMEWMQGMLSLISLYVNTLSDIHNYFLLLIPSPWEWGQPFQHAGWYGWQYDPTACRVDGYAGHGYARHGELLKYYFEFWIMTIPRVGWEVACQWTIPSSPQCGEVCLAGPWAAWTEEWWRCVMYIVHVDKGRGFTLGAKCPRITFQSVGLNIS